MSTLINEALKAKLEALAKKETWMDSADFNAMDFSGGNYDDCYSQGLTDGEAYLARDLLALYFNTEQPS